MNVAEWADRQFERFGEFEALVHGDQTWTNGQVNDAACRFAAALGTLGATAGDRVILWLPSDPDLLIAFTGVLRAGCVSVILSDSAPVAEVERVASYCSARIIVTADRLITEKRGVPTNQRGTVVAELHDGQIARESPVGLAQLLKTHSPLARAAERTANDPAQIVFTSGTTSAPKGVVWTQGALKSRYERFLDTRPPAARPIRALCALPLAGSFGAQYLYFRLLQKLALVLMDRFEPECFLQLAEQQRIDLAWLVPSMCEALLAVPRQERFDLSRLSTLYVGGAPLLPALVDRFRSKYSATLINVYGSTEVGAIAGSTLGDRSSSVDGLRPGATVRIVDAHRREQKRGDIGEIEVLADDTHGAYFSPSVPDGVGDRDGWFRTGDQGRLDAEGRLHLMGRTKDLIIQGGVNIYPDDIREVLLALPDIHACAVVGIPEPFLGEEAVACVVLTRGSALTPSDILAHCHVRLDSRKRPTRVQILEDLPRHESGKVDTDRLRKWLVVERTQNVDTELLQRLRRLSSGERRKQLRDEILTRLAQILRRGSNTTSATVDSTATFGRLGLDSLGAVELASSLGAAIGRPLSATLTFNHPTVAALSDHLSNVLAGEPSSKASPGSAPGASVRSPVAIIGIGCRLPAGADTPDRLWKLLVDGVDATREITRWDMDALYDPVRGVPGKTYTRRAAMLGDIDGIDAEFFGMSRREARGLDPHHQLALEVTWEALENAGYNPFDLAGASVGVFLGMSGSTQGRDAPIGDVPAMAVGRICHFLDLRGPASMVDTTCSSSLFAIHQAVQNLRLGECDVAIAGGVHVIVSPRSFVGLSQMGLIAADGRCKAFDTTADGYGRGEGCAVVVLKRLADTQADRDRIVAVIRGSAARHDGRSSSLTAPNGSAQQSVIRAALRDAGLQAGEVDYLEAHGAGTALGDPIEMEAAMSVFSDRVGPLTVGSIKTNFGHLEAAAGVVALVKTALALRHARIPAHLHCNTLNPLLRPLSAGFVIPSSSRPWPAGQPGHRRTAGVSSMGLSGTNVHVVLQDAPPQLSIVTDVPSPEDVGVQLLCASACGQDALDEQARRYVDHFAGAPTTAFADDCFTANAGRTHFAHRLAVVARDPSEASALLGARTPDSAGRRLRGVVTKRPRIAFLFTGQGSQYVGMGRRLYHTEPVFREALNRCDEITRDALPRRLIEALHTPPAGSFSLDEMVLAQPCLVALQWALCELWRSWGIEPDILLGHSIGECAAACVAGVLGVEDALRLSVARGRLLHALPSSGAMVAVKASSERVREAIGDRAADVAIAAYNGPLSTVISGSEDGVAAVTRVLAAAGVENRRLTISRASHSPLVDPLMDELETVASGLRYAPLQRPLASTLTGHLAGSNELSQPLYWRRQIREPVRFADAMASVASQGCDVFLEIGPHPVLTVMGQDCVSLTNTAAWLPSLRRERHDREQIFETLAELYVRGSDPAWEAFYRPHSGLRRSSLPTYPFQRPSAATTPVRPIRVTRDNGTSEERHTAAPLRRCEDVVQHVCQQVADVLGCPPSSIAPDQNILRLGLDSLRLLDIITGIRRSLGVICTPRDLMSRPSAQAFAEFLFAQIARLDTNQPRREPATAYSAPALEVASAKPLVVLNPRGRRTPIFCMHPSGGQVTAYLRLCTLTADDQPLYAIQSRALDHPEREHASVESMAIDYATLVQVAQPAGPYRLLGWSMGAFVAHATAAELERRGERVAMVGLIDPLGVRAGAPGGYEAEDVLFALEAMRHQLQLARPSSETIAAIRSIPGLARLRPSELLKRCEQLGMVPTGVVTESEFDVTMRLYLRHFGLVRAHQPGVVEAPLIHWLASADADVDDWSQHARGPVTRKVVGGTHFSIVRSPQIEVIAADMFAAEAAHSAMS